MFYYIVHLILVRVTIFLIEIFLHRYTCARGLHGCKPRVLSVFPATCDNEPTSCHPDSATTQWVYLETRRPPALHPNRLTD